ncbi:MAG: hypothetical protein R3F59_16495 [Myxococcota bacterium]
MRTPMLTIGLAALMVGCADDGGPAPLGPQGTLVRLTAGDAAQDPVIGALASRFDVVDGAGLELERLIEALGDASILAADAEALSDVDPGTLSVIGRAADAFGLTIVLENVHDADHASRLIGIGLSGDVLYATPNGKGYDVRVFGGESTVSVSEEEADATTAGVPLDVPPADDIALEIADQIAHREAAEQLGLHAVTEWASTIDGRFMPQAAYRYYYIDNGTLSYSPGGVSQTANLGMDYEVELFALPQGKFAHIRSRAEAFQPGSLYVNSSSHRGYFQEAVDVEVRPLDDAASFSLYDHNPKTTQISQTFATTTGWTIGADATSEGVAGISASYSESDTLTKSIPEWG